MYFSQALTPSLILVIRATQAAYNWGKLEVPRRIGISVSSGSTIFCQVVSGWAMGDFSNPSSIPSLCGADGSFSVSVIEGMSNCLGSEREVDRDGLTAGASLAEDALLKEYEGLVTLTPRVLALEGGANFSGSLKCPPLKQVFRMLTNSAYPNGLLSRRSDNDVKATIPATFREIHGKLSDGLKEKQWKYDRTPLPNASCSGNKSKESIVVTTEQHRFCQQKCHSELIER
ncbi:uncharacterized protein LACBIDRAFT_332643 [Laccaria bicolor S238N-H82]|uniref:Predicted protein n=1 Tax=Laccaria bicolor (strain S238N-H82 / ATCC MYA-4686) TaxID=486041 RepID=B0DTE9_LACBS|nr:uncharacterized protein LACBIDRAFT_332643 [Laccaria bicolor S238N-H82]EDR02050.1 predicted protein [Laccaria bicolor S238N-H82]|eukprot:XP_001887207.1 predicted protein [Laccaria bicolor S238N-H82]